MVTRAYLSHPYQGKPENLARARRWIAWLAKQHPDWVIVASWIMWAELGLFRTEAEALAACCEEIETCNVFVLCGVEPAAWLTRGTRTELQRARLLHMRREEHWRLEPPVE